MMPRFVSIASSHLKDIREILANYVCAGRRSPRWVFAVANYNRNRLIERTELLRFVKIDSRLDSISRLPLPKNSPLGQSVPIAHSFP